MALGNLRLPIVLARAAARSGPDRPRRTGSPEAVECTVTVIEVGYAVGLYDHAMRGAAVEGIADSVLVRVKAVRANLRRSQHALAKILHEHVRTILDCGFSDAMLWP